MLMATHRYKINEDFTESVLIPTQQLLVERILGDQLQSIRQRSTLDVKRDVPQSLPLGKDDFACYSREFSYISKILYREVAHKMEFMLFRFVGLSGIRGVDFEEKQV